MFCENCRRIHHELPGTIVPYKRYSAEVVEEILSGQEKEPSYPCETSTALHIRNWFSLLRDYLESVIEALKLLYKNDLPLLAALEQLQPLKPSLLPAGWLKSLVRIVVNSGRWVQTRSA